MCCVAHCCYSIQLMSHWSRAPEIERRGRLYGYIQIGGGAEMSEKTNMLPKLNILHPVKTSGLFKNAWA